MFGKRSKHVFISYDHEDRKIAETLERCLNNAGFDVWWDERLQTGQKWAQEIDEALLSATAVIVLWSNRAIHSEWVQHEASIAKIRNVLTHANIDEVSVPNIFGSIQCSNLSTWSGSNEDPSFLRLVDGIKNTRWQNKIQQLRRTAVISVTTLLIAVVLIFVGIELQKLFAGPGKKTVTIWKAGTDYVQITLNMTRLRQFYNSEQWGCGFPL